VVRYLVRLNEPMAAQLEGRHEHETKQRYGRHNAI